MTSSIRSRLSGNNPSRGSRHVDPEERFAQRVTLLFIALIAAVVVVVVAAFIYDYYVGHLKPVASVGGESITRDQWSARARLELERLQLQEQNTREQIAAGTLSPEEGNVRLQNITTAQSNVASTSIENLIDLAFKGRLARDAGLAVTDADVDAAITKEGTSPEARRISVVFVEPDAVAPTPETNQAAFTAAQDAAAALASGTPFAEVAAEYSTHESKDEGGEYGFVTADSTLDPAFIGTLFALAEGETTPVIRGADGVWRIGRVDAIQAGSMDPGLEQVMRDQVGWDLYRSEVRKEVLAQKLEDKVVAEATAGDVDQARVAQILLEGDTTGTPEEDEGQIRASHILYSPGDDPGAARELDPADPAWEEARAEADRAFREIARVTDPVRREVVFGVRAKSQSDDTTSGANGGSLGFFSRGGMVPEFGDPLFDNPDLNPSDLIGPVRSDFGWHVILFQERTPGMGQRIDEVVAALAEDDADFGEVAMRLSDGAQAPAGGDLGWLTATQLEEEAATAIFALEPGAHTEAIPGDEGYSFYQQTEREARPLDLQQRALVADTAFEEWYTPLKEDAVTNDVITRDEDLFSSTPQVV